MSCNILQTLLLIALFPKDFTYGVRLLEVRIPNYVIKDTGVQLECLYDLDGEALYSVKWYKDGNEFYRYLPRDTPPAQTFLLPGISVDVHNSSDAIVALKNVNLQTAGRFRCEVSAEAPSFQTVTEHADMVVVSLPDQGPPRITGGRPRYQIGDWVNINCTAGRSKPAVQLIWYVNGEPVEPSMTKKYQTIISGRDGLETSILGLQFRVGQHHFRNGDMKLKCVAALSTLYWRSNEESVEGDRPQRAPVLESRETVYASNSRADPVQASSTDSMKLKNSPKFLLLTLLLLTLTIFSGRGGGRCGSGNGNGCCILERLHLQQLERSKRNKNENENENGNGNENEDEDEDENEDENIKEMKIEEIEKCSKEAKQSERVKGQQRISESRGDDDNDKHDDDDDEVEDDNDEDDYDDRLSVITFMEHSNEANSLLSSTLLSSSSLPVTTTTTTTSSTASSLQSSLFTEFSISASNSLVTVVAATATKLPTLQQHKSLTVR